MSDETVKQSEGPSSLEARVVELEIALAFERQHRVDLDEVVREFAKRVETLEHRLAELGEAVRATGTGAPDLIDDEGAFDASC